MAQNLPNWIGISGGVLLAVAGAAMISVRPADKAAQNEADVCRYTALAAKAHTLDDAALAAAIDEAHQSDCQEIEALRDVAYNDVVTEFGRADAAIPLTRLQLLFAALA
jgi:hypothetical protein